jgi:transposase
MPGDRSFQLLEVRAERLEASPASPRRRWSAEAKARLVAEAMDPNANVSAIARRNGLSPAQLFGWRRQALKPMAGLEKPRIDPMPISGFVEITVAGATIRVGADVAEEQLARVIRAVRSA